ncbi:MAG TPA: Ku protein [Xanthobacteraceae bacterium]|jgi:DNA end-binding protein Ku
MQVVAMIHHEGAAYGVSFPDFPGCTTVADDLDGALAKAAEVLAFHAEGLAEDGPLPLPRSLSELKSDPDFCEDAKDAVLVLVPYEPPTRAVRINITLEESLLARIDRSADAASETRSGYLAAAARLRMGMLGERPTSKLSRSTRDGVAGGIGPTNRLGAPWKGYLKLSLVSCPIFLHPASSDEAGLPFVQLNRKTGNRLKYQLVDSETGQVVDLADRARGYEIGKEEFLLVEDHELAALQIESTHTIEIDAFVPRAQLDLRYLISPYYIAPDFEVAQEAFALIREAMRAKKMVAIARVVLTNRERPILLEPFGKGLSAIALRYPYEVSDEAESFANIPDTRVPREMRQLAEHILETKATDFDLSRFKDRYELALVEMLKRKQTGLPAKSAALAPSPSNVIDLMDALRRSLKTDRRSSARRSSRNKRAGGSTK